MFLDIGLGIISAILTSEILKIKLKVSLVIVSVIFALLPDLDSLFFLLKRKKIDKYFHEHRHIFHYPLLYILVGSLLLSVVGLKWVFVFAVASFLHFTHDSFGIGWGVKWLHPFSKKNYKLFAWPHPEVYFDPSRIFVSLSDEKLKETVKKIKEENWVRKYVFSFHPLPVAEFILFLVVCVILYFYFK